MESLASPISIYSAQCRISKDKPNASSVPIEIETDLVLLCIDKFIKTEADFVRALLDVFPECTALHTAKFKFDIACKISGQKRQRVEEWIHYMFQISTSKKPIFKYFII